MRYLGSKLKLLPKIDKLLSDKNLKNTRYTFCDLFCGTAVVADFFKKYYDIIANDTLYLSYVIALGKLLFNEKKAFCNLGFDPFLYFNNTDTTSYTQGFCYNNFAPLIAKRQYFCDLNAQKIDFIRDTIDIWYGEKKIDDIEKAYLIASLLESVSKVSNVAGVYGAYLRTWDPRALKKMQFIPLEKMEDSLFNNKVYQKKAEDLIKQINGDILYLDPPYTSTQYLSQYHVLETIARNDRPQLHGSTARRDIGCQASLWCKNALVHKAFEEVISNAHFKYIIISYSDSGLMSKKFIIATLKRYAKEKTYKCYEISFAKYKNTRALEKEKKCEKKKEHFEWLFFIEKKENVVYPSPLNYIGGKQDIMPFLKENLPKDTDTFFDLFAGGANVLINANAKKLVYNDINYMLKDLLEKITTTNIKDIYDYIKKTIKAYNLQKGCKEAYTHFRAVYNSKKPQEREPLDLYLLICYGFEHQIRYNKDMAFNNPCGNSGFSPEMFSKLVSYNYITSIKDIKYYAKDYLLFEHSIKTSDFVYCDPPYLKSCGAYNDGKRGFNGWNEKQESTLLAFLDRLNARGIRFMLSNMKSRNNQDDKTLLSWLEKSPYTLIENKAQTKRNKQDRLEIIIKNY